MRAKTIYRPAKNEEMPKSKNFQYRKRIEAENVLLKDIEIGKNFIYNNKKYVKMSSNLCQSEYNVAYVKNNDLKGYIDVIPESLSKYNIVTKVD